MRKVTVFSTKKIADLQKIHDILPEDRFDFHSLNFISTPPKTISHDTQLLPNIIISSQNALPELKKHFSQQSLQAEQFRFFCVGKTTAQRVSETFIPPQFVADTAQKLAHHVVQQPHTKYSYVCSENRLDALPKMLIDHGIRCREVHAYRTVLNPQRMTIAPDAILFFSPSGVQSFFSLNQTNRAVAFCIGSTTATEAQRRTKIKVISCQEPALECMLRRIKNHHFNAL